jgi:6-phosphofructokinase 2
MLSTLTLNPALDVSLRVPALEPDRKMYARGVCEQPGGGGVNVARVARRFGSDVLAVVLSGGATGELIVDLLRAEGVPVEAVLIAGETRRNMTVTDDSTGRQYRFVMPGPHVTMDELGAALAAVTATTTSSNIVVVSGSVPSGLDPEAVARGTACIEQAGGRLIVDVPGDALGAFARAGTTLLKPSLRELEQFVGRSLGTHAEIDCAARALLTLGPNRNVIVSLGATGAMLVREDDSSVWLHAPHVGTVSTVGAGDSLVAACAVALERGLTMVDAAQLGVAAGTAATTVAGTGLCEAAVAEELRGSVTATVVPGT